MTAENEFIPPCVECGGQCCDYVAIEIDKPRTKTDYDYIRWYLLHEKVHIFIDHEKNWHVEFRTGCTEQKKDKNCGIYTTRPKICQDYGETDGECQYFDNPYHIYFSTVEEFEQFLTNKGVDWKFKKIRT